MQDFPAARTIGARIRASREGLGLTQEDLAAMTETDKANVGKIERGQANTTMRTLLMMAAALEADPGEWLAGLTIDDLPPGTRILTPQKYRDYREEMDRQRPRWR